MALTRITKGVIKPNENYDTHNINSTGIVTAIGLDVNGNGDISGNLSVGGVLTYEDVTSIDSVGIITAQSDIHVGAGLSVVGVGSFGSLDISGDIDVDGHTNLDNVSIAGVTTFTGNPTIHNADPQLTFRDSNHSPFYYYLKGRNGAFVFEDSVNGDRITLNANGSISIVAGTTVFTGGAQISTNLGVTGNIILGDQIQHSGDTDTRIRFPANDTIRFETAGSQRLNINSSGNVSITNDLDVDGHTNLDNTTVAGITTFTNVVTKFKANNGGNTHLQILSTGTGEAGIFFDAANGDISGSDYAFIGQQNNLDFVIKANPNAGNIDFQRGTDTKVRIDTSGNLNVNYDLDVDGHTNLDNVSVGGATTCNGGAVFLNSISLNASSNNYLYFDDNLHFSRNGHGTEMMIDGSGRLMVGTSAVGRSGAQNLTIGNTGDQGMTIRSGTSHEGNIYFSDGSSGGNEESRGIFRFDHSDDSFQFYTASGNNFSQHRLRITSAGLVGINTTNPSTYLMISGAGNQRQDMLRLQHEGQRNFYIQGQWGNTDVGGSNGILQYVDGGGIAFRSGATGAAGMIVSQANKVGIHTNNPEVNLHANHTYTTNSSLTWGANCGQIFRNEHSELAFGLQNTAPYPYYLQARTNANSARELALNPRGGPVSVGTINSFSRAFTVNGTVGVISLNQTAAMDMSITDSGDFELGAYHSNGGSVTLKTAPAGAGNQTRLVINKDGQLTHTTNKASEFTAKFVQANASNPAWIEIDSPQDNNLRPSYIQFKNAGNDKWGIGQVYNPTGGQSFHITEGTHNQANSHFVIKSNNYVGINTNNPQSALHVRGGGGIRIDTLSGTPIASNSNVITDGGGNPIISGTPWYMAHTYQWQGSYSGMGYYWIKVVKSLGNSAIGYIDYMAHGDSNYPRHCRGTIAIAKYANGSISCCHDQQTHEGGGNIQLKLCADGTVWIRLHAYDWNSDFRFRLVYGEDVTLNTVFDVTGSSDNSYGRIDPRGGGSPVNASNDILPGANMRYSISSNTFNPASANSSYGGDSHRFFKIDVANQLIKGSGSFRIDHPLAGMSTSHYLQHSFVEGPQADNIYRGKTTLVSGISTVNIDTASNMTDGTFVELNTDVQCFTTNETGWTPIKGSVSGNKLTILAQDNSCTDTISWMVVGERQDDNIKNKADWTDSDGKVIVELPKKTVGYAGTESPYDEFK